MSEVTREQIEAWLRESIRGGAGTFSTFGEAMFRGVFVNSIHIAGGVIGDDILPANWGHICDYIPTACNNLPALCRHALALQDQLDASRAETAAERKVNAAQAEGWRVDQERMEGLRTVLQSIPDDEDCGLCRRCGQVELVDVVRPGGWTASIFRHDPGRCWYGRIQEVLGVFK